MSTLNELAAVNQILAAQGLAPVSTIEGSTSKNTQIALNMLRETSRQVQSRGWDFTTVQEYTLALDPESGEITYPDTMTRFTVHTHPWIEQRGGRLFDRKKQSYTFTSAISGTAQFLHAWDDLPFEAQNYIAQKAARKTYEQYVGADETRQSLYLEEKEARLALDQREAETGMHSALNDPYLPHLRGSSYVPGGPKYPRY